MQNTNYRQGFIDKPMKEGIILRHLGVSNPEIETNVPWKVISHSPDGYNWGYGGSGPADLALNIAENVLLLEGYEGPREKGFKGECFKAAFVVHQDVKREFIEPLPHDYDKPAEHHLDYERVALFVLNRLDKYLAAAAGFSKVKALVYMFMAWSALFFAWGVFVR